MFDLLLAAGEPGKILVMVRDERTRTQLQEVLEVGAREMLNNRFEKFLESRNNASTESTTVHNEPVRMHPAPPQAFMKGKGRGRGAPRGRGRGKGKQPTVSPVSELNGLMKLYARSKTANSKTTSSANINNNNSDVSAVFQPIVKKAPQGIEEFDLYFGILPAPYIIIQSMAARQRVLTEFRPKFVIIFDPDIAFFRQLEVQVNLLSVIHLRFTNAKILEYHSECIGFGTAGQVFLKQVLECSCNVEWRKSVTLQVLTRKTKLSRL